MAEPAFLTRQLTRWCLIFAAVPLFLGCASVPDTPIPIEPVPDESALTDWLRSIEQITIETTNRIFESQNPREMYDLKRDAMAWTVEAAENPAINYWLAFIDFNLAQFEAEMGSQEQAATLIEASIRTLEQSGIADAEAFALLAILYREKVHFAPQDTFNLMSRLNSTISKGVELDEWNLRIHLALAIRAVRPVPGFGTGDNVRDVIDGAVATSLNATNDSSYDSSVWGSYPPTWGRARILALQASFLKSEGRTEDASEVLRRGLNEFPGHFKLLEQL